MPACKKRIVIADLFDREGNMISSGMNSCSPENGICPRINIVSTKENYPVDKCNSLHAEQKALQNLGNKKPYRVKLFGHTFFCPDCEAALKHAGVEVFEIHKD